MKFADVANHIGHNVYLNGNGDLAFDGLCRPYIYPRPPIPFVFTIIKVTRGGRVHIQCDSDKKFLTVNATNVDLVEPLGQNIESPSNSHQQPQPNSTAVDIGK